MRAALAGRLHRLGRDGTLRRLLAFLAVGVLNTAVGYAIYAGLVLAGLGPMPALVLSFGLGVLWNYGTHARLVFGHRGLNRLPAYGASYLLILGINALALRAALAAGLAPLAAQALLAPVSALLAFVLISRVLRPR